MRPRAPDFDGLEQAILRAIAIGLGIANLALYIYDTVNVGLVIYVAYAAAGWTIIYNAIDLFLLLDKGRRFPRPWPWLYALLEFISTILTAAAGVMTVLSGFLLVFDESYSGLLVAAAMNFILCVMHFVLFIWLGDCCGLVQDKPSDPLLTR